MHLSEDAKAIVASNLTLAIMVRDHALSAANKLDMDEDSTDAVRGFYKEFLSFLDTN